MHSHIYPTTQTHFQKGVMVMPLETKQQTYKQKFCQTALINQMGNANRASGPLTYWKNLRFKQETGRVQVIAEYFPTLHLIGNKGK